MGGVPMWGRLCLSHSDYVCGRWNGGALAVHVEPHWDCCRCPRKCPCAPCKGKAVCDTGVMDGLPTH